jgi:hypothetical protein
MTPQDVRGPIITAQTLSPWLRAMAPTGVEPPRPLPRPVPVAARAA